MPRAGRRQALESYGMWARTGLMQNMSADHAHADIELNYLFSGSLRYFLGGRFLAVPPGRLVAFWAAIPHQSVQSPPGTEVAWVCVPLGRFLGWDLGPAAVSRLLAGELVADGAARAEDGPRFRQWAADSADGTGALEDGAPFVLEVRARLARLLASAERARGAHAAGAPTRVEEMTSWIAEHLTEAISIGQIARAVGLNPTYAMSLFRQACGMSIWRYVTRMRLAHAQRLLATTRRTTLDIALGSGFGSLARFYDVFHRELGIPPGEFRRRQAPA